MSPKPPNGGNSTTSSTFEENSTMVYIGAFTTLTLAWLVAYLVANTKNKTKRSLIPVRTVDDRQQAESIAAADGERLRDTLWPRVIGGRFVTFFRYTLPLRMWNSYIEAFLVPSYRWEWGKYQEWSYRSPQRLEEYENVRIKILRPHTTKSAPKYHSDSRNRVHKTHKPGEPTHDHSLCEIVTINVSGRKFDTQARTLLKYPETVLGDPVRLHRFYDPEADEYFFDRNATCFESIIQFYQSGGKLRRPFNVGIEMFYEELLFFDFPSHSLHGFQVEEGFLPEDHRLVPKNLLRRKLWVLFEYPESSAQARMVAVLSVMVIIIAITNASLETLPVFHFENRGSDIHTFRDSFVIVETICLVWFNVEFLVRIACCPELSSFALSITNWIDILSILPYIVTVIEILRVDVDSSPYTVKVLNGLRILKLIRIFRILKLSRHYHGLKVLILTMKASLRELGLLMFFLCIGIVVFSSAVYFADLDNEDTEFTSIPAAFWWAIITMTTVGFGDSLPTTTLAKIFASCCAMTGVLTLALPVPVIVSNFNTFYHESLRDHSLELTGLEYPHTDHCPYLSAKYDDNGDVVEDPTGIYEPLQGQRTESPQPDLTLSAQGSQMSQNSEAMGAVKIVKKDVET